MQPLVGLTALLASAAATATMSVADEAALSRFAGTPVRLFDPFEARAEVEFAHFLEVVPMLNQRPLPRQAVGETRAALSLLRAVAAPAEPTYFVATDLARYVTPGMPASRTAELRARYGELLWPQRVCPIFATRADGDVAAMLGAASNLPAGIFRDSPGRLEAYHELFLLTEASHCGLLARLPAADTLLAGLRTTAQLRALIEALGDYEATIAVRRLQPATQGHPDEADVLHAARTLAMLLGDPASAYAQIPALMLAFVQDGVPHTARRLDEVADIVTSARSAVAHLIRASADETIGREQLRRLAASVREVLRGRGDLSMPVGDPARALLERFPEAVAIVLHEAGSAQETRVEPRWVPLPTGEAVPSLLTLPGFAEQRTAAAVPPLPRAGASNRPMAAPFRLP